jgi:hypothetical protein
MSPSNFAANLWLARRAPFSAALLQHCSRADELPKAHGKTELPNAGFAASATSYSTKLSCSTKTTSGVWLKTTCAITIKIALTMA